MNSKNSCLVPSSWNIKHDPNVIIRCHNAIKITHAWVDFLGVSSLNLNLHIFPSLIYIWCLKVTRNCGEDWRCLSYMCGDGLLCEMVSCKTNIVYSSFNDNSDIRIKLLIYCCSFFIYYKTLMILRCVISLFSFYLSSLWLHLTCTLGCSLLAHSFVLIQGLYSSWNNV